MQPEEQDRLVDKLVTMYERSLGAQSNSDTADHNFWIAFALGTGSGSDSFKKY